ncbi:Alcohol dehydrogenase superfamily zinc-containing [Macrophomina phaseolina MS6]|uniref:Alcohol dehydrogenase superfamily zinc-containing n=1 Tax=Macrophomina phaseolina (strain MS6) TaxID=1126212 RepID=K2RV72_MACPH|nr:Alcohol dehydrogenase superfamily zinc-containing [Macrophomina phaseolina MS6]
MALQRAIQIQGPKVAKLVSDAPIPKLREGYLRVKTVAVALNPTDWKHIDFLASKGAIVGCDYSGIVEEVGPGVTGFSAGDRVAGFVHGSNQDNHEDGSFAEHIAAKAALQLKVPSNLSMEEAATLGVGITTVGQGLYQSLGLPWPSSTSTSTTTTTTSSSSSSSSSSPSSILIYGGSTATGTLAIQFAKLSGLTVHATASPHNHALLRRLGADHVYDYRSPDVGAQIRAATEDRLALAFDCIASADTAAICAAALTSRPNVAKYSALLRLDSFPRDDVSSAGTLAYTALGEPFHKGEKAFAADEAHLTFAERFWKAAAELLAQGRVKVHPPEVREGGLEAVLEGVDDLRKDGVSGVKLVYRV